MHEEEGEMEEEKGRQRDLAVLTLLVEVVAIDEGRRGSGHGTLEDVEDCRLNPVLLLFL